MSRISRVQVVGLGGLVAGLLATGTVLLLVPRPTVATTAATVTVTTTDDARVVCAPLAEFAVDALQASDLVLAGRVESVQDGSAAIAPTRVFHVRGPAVGLLRIRADAGGGPSLDGPVLREGDRVLVAAVDGRAQGCGLSAAASPELLRLYESAF